MQDQPNRRDFMKVAVAMPGAVSQRRLEDMVKLKAAVDNRKLEALGLYEPLPFQQAYHQLRNKELIMNKGTQVGGSLAGYVEVARAVTGQDPYDKYPKKNGIAVCLGYGEKHIGRVIHKYLFRVGAFKIIKDLETGEWRTWKPWLPEDKDREAEAALAPPLIPERFIDGKISWEKRAERVFSYVKFTTGWELYALNSAGDPSQAQGFAVNLYDIDEDLATGGWYEEAVSRTSMPGGLIRWHAVPQGETEDMMNMLQRAEAEEENGTPVNDRMTMQITATIYDNPYMPAESREHNAKIWRALGEDVYRKRALGEIDNDSTLMYPTFDKRVHDAMLCEHPAMKLIQDRGGVPPDDWCRYMILDPGHGTLALLFVATCPPAFGEFTVVYDERAVRTADRYKFGAAAKEAIGEQIMQDFIIDAHGGRLRELGSGVLPKKQYEDELQTLGIRCQARGSRFTHGSDDVEGRELIVRNWLAIRRDGTSRLMFVAKRVPNTIREMSLFKKITVKVGGHKIPTDKGNRRANTHFVEDVEYACANGVPYIKPKPKTKRGSAIQWIKEERKRRAKMRAMKNYDPSRNTRALGPRGSTQVQEV
jgi:hypothetical protein